MGLVEIHDDDISEIAGLIAAAVPDVDHLTWLLTHGGGCDDLVAALPVAPPSKSSKFTGGRNIALNKAARLLKQHVPDLAPLLRLLEGSGGCKRLLRALYGPPLSIDTRPV